MSSLLEKILCPFFKIVYVLILVAESGWIFCSGKTYESSCNRTETHEKVAPDRYELYNKTCKLLLSWKYVSASFFGFT